jgi:hypothetical protein
MMYPLDVIQFYADEIKSAELLNAVDAVRKELYSLRLRDAQMEAAEAAGIDNWSGWGEVDHVDEETFDHDLPRC